MRATKKHELSEGLQAIAVRECHHEKRDGAWEGAKQQKAKINLVWHIIDSTWFGTH